MPRAKGERFCSAREEAVDITVHYTTCGNNRIPTGVECSASPNGHCGKCDTCYVLKEAQDDVRNNVIEYRYRHKNRQAILWLAGI